MLGVAPFPRKTRADEIVEEYARSINADTFEPAPVGVWFGEPGKEVPDPYFGGEGPSRTGCIQCGGCMVGCQHNAKNTLDKNYLYLAENRGVQIIPETRVTGLRPLEGGGYELDVERSTSRFFKKRRTMTAGQVVLSGGVLGTVPLLMTCQHRGMLKDLSPQLPATSCGPTTRPSSGSAFGTTPRTSPMAWPSPRRSPSMSTPTSSPFVTLRAPMR